MTGQLIPPSTEAHRCEGRPERAEGLAVGTIWKCDDCGKESVVVVGAQYNETYYAWRNASLPTIAGESRGSRSSDASTGGPA